MTKPRPKTKAPSPSPLVGTEDQFTFRRRKTVSPEYVALYKQVAGMKPGQVLVQELGPHDDTRRLFNRIGSALHRCPTSPPSGFRYARRITDDGRVAVVLRPVHVLPGAGTPAKPVKPSVKTKTATKKTSRTRATKKR